MRELFSPSIKVGPLLVDLDAAFAVVAFDVGGRRRTVPKHGQIRSLRW